MPQEQKIIAGLILMAAFFILTVFFLIVLVSYFHKRKRALLFEQKALQSSYENELLKTKLEVQEQTLHDISQEIHDNIGQSLSFIKLTVALVNLDNRPDAEQKLLEANGQLIRTIKDLRVLSQTMNADYIGRTGLVAAITRQVEVLKRTVIYQIVFELQGEVDNYPAQQELVLYRIFQEIINNIVKHARAGTISITLHYKPDGLLLQVKDDGIGFDQTSIMSNSSRGLGLGNIISRMQLINGQATIDSQPGGGTRVLLALPLVRALTDSKSEL